MPVPDFSPGEVLTAAAMDSIGLWKVASGALSGVSTNFVGCFTSDYNNYRIVVDRLSFNATGDIYIRMLSGTTPASGATEYQYAFTGLTSAGGAANITNAGTNAGFIGASNNLFNNGAVSSVSADIYSPAVTQRTIFTISSISHPSAVAHRTGALYHNPTTAYDGIQFLTLTATTFTGNVTIYGYRT
jgi:hypothetical protein